MAQLRRTFSQLESEKLNELQRQLNSIDPKSRSNPDEKIQLDPRYRITRIRDELIDGRRALIEVRRTRLKQLFLQEVTAQEASMRRRGYAYIPTQP